jgi:aconitase B
MPPQAENAKSNAVLLSRTANATGMQNAEHLERRTRAVEQHLDECTITVVESQALRARQGGGPRRPDARERLRQQL